MSPDPQLPESTEPTPTKVPPTPLRCFVGSGISGTLAWGLYWLTSSIALTFATKPVLSDKAIVQRIASAVRTLVLGLASLGTFIFAFVAIGLILLGVQLLFQKPATQTEGDD
ncbi:MAG: DUF3082 domain-containing protein [Synechocystis sp.]